MKNINLVVSVGPETIRKNEYSCQQCVATLVLLLKTNVLLMESNHRERTLLKVMVNVLRPFK